MISDQDFERLSAYMDHQLSAAEKSTLEARLAREPELKSALNDLRLNARTLSDLPQLKPPRNFTLTAAQAQAIRSKSSPWTAWLPTLRLATAAATFAFVAVLGLDLLGAGNLAQPQRIAETQEMMSAMQASEANKAADASGTPMAEVMPMAPATVDQAGTAGLTASGAGGGTEAATLEAVGTPEPPARSALTATEAPAEATVVALALDAYPVPEATNPTQDVTSFAATAPAPAASPWRAWTIGMGVLAAALALTTWIMTRRR